METFNKHLVGVQGEKVVIVNPPRTPMEKSDALLFAAWIVALADPGKNEFEKILQAVINS